VVKTNFTSFDLPLEKFWKNHLVNPSDAHEQHTEKVFRHITCTMSYCRPGSAWFRFLN